MIVFRAASIRPSVVDSTTSDPPKGSTEEVIPVSSARICWVLRARFAEASVGRPRASSSYWCEGIGYPQVLLLELDKQPAQHCLLVVGQLKSPLKSGCGI